MDLLEIAQDIAQNLTVQKVGLRLGVEQRTIDAILSDNQNNIVIAAHSVLKTWKQTMGYQDDTVAILGEALIGAGQAIVAVKRLGYKKKS